MYTSYPYSISNFQKKSNKTYQCVNEQIKDSRKENQESKKIELQMLQVLKR